MINFQQPPKLNNYGKKSGGNYGIYYGVEGSRIYSLF